MFAAGVTRAVSSGWRGLVLAASLPSYAAQRGKEKSTRGTYPRSIMGSTRRPLALSISSSAFPDCYYARYKQSLPASSRKVQSS